MDMTKLMQRTLVGIPKALLGPGVDIAEQAGVPVIPTRAMMPSDEQTDMLARIGVNSVAAPLTLAPNIVNGTERFLRWVFGIDGQPIFQSGDALLDKGLDAVGIDPKSSGLLEDAITSLAGWAVTGGLSGYLRPKKVLDKNLLRQVMLGPVSSVAANQVQTQINDARNCSPNASEELARLMGCTNQTQKK